MKKSILAAVFLIGVSATYGIDDSKQVQSDISGAYKAWEVSVERANRDYHRKVLQIRQDQKKKLESDRDKLARAKRYEEVAGLTAKIEELDQQIETAREQIRAGSKPNEIPVAVGRTVDKDSDEKADWYKGEWLLRRSNGKNATRTVQDDGTIKGLDQYRGTIKKIEPTRIITQWGGVEERWYLQDDGTILSVETENEGDTIRAMGILKRR